MQGTHARIVLFACLVLGILLPQRLSAESGVGHVPQRPIRKFAEPSDVVAPVALFVTHPDPLFDSQLLTKSALDQVIRTPRSVFSGFSHL